MIGFILLYFIGKYFYKLAEEYNKSKWLFAIFGVVVYYAGTFIGGIFIALFYEFILNKNIDSFNDIALSLIALPIGLASCWGFYAILKKQWKGKHTITDPDILDEEFLN